MDSIVTACYETRTVGRQGAFPRSSIAWEIFNKHGCSHNLVPLSLFLLVGVKVEDYLTVHIHRNTAKKQRVWYPGMSGNNVLTGAYTNSPQVLVRYDVTSQADKYLNFVLSQYQKTRDIPYTLSIFATEDFTLSRPPKDLAHCVEVTSGWTERTAGGRYSKNNDAFTTNPQFAVQIPAGGTTVELRLSTSKTASVNGMLIPVQKFGQDVSQATGLAVLDTGKYRHGFVCSGTRQHIQGGSYVLVVSNFNGGQQAVFQIKLCSSAKIKLREIAS